jgi:hypothetical protein
MSPSRGECFAQFNLLLEFVVSSDGRIVARYLLFESLSLRRGMNDQNIFGNSEVRKALQYPVFEAIARRRGRRFPVGCTSPDGVMHHESGSAPLPLNDIESALLCWAGAGITGMITGDLPTRYGGNIFGSWVGKATPYGCNVHNARLFFTNDSGTFLYDPQRAAKHVEIESESDWDRIITQYGEGCTKLSNERVEFNPKLLGGMMSWNINQPGTTVFIPVIDQSEEYINFMLGIFDREGYGYRMIDDMQGQSAGLKSFIDAGQLKGPEIPVSSTEVNLFYGEIAPAYLILENISLAAEAIGLGAIMFSGYTGQIVLGVTPWTRGLGFRSCPGKDGKVNPVGLDGIFEAYCPPYYKSMADAVDAFIEKKYGAGGIYSSGYSDITPFKDWKRIQADFHRPSKLSVDQVKAYFNYLYDTYGRVPATFDTKILPVWLQVHHLDIEFYDKHFPPEMVTQAHRDHIKSWHER